MIFMTAGVLHSVRYAINHESDAAVSGAARPPLDRSRMRGRGSGACAYNPARPTGRTRRPEPETAYAPRIELGQRVTGPAAAGAGPLSGLRPAFIVTRPFPCTNESISSTTPAT